MPMPYLCRGTQAPPDAPRQPHFRWQVTPKAPFKVVAGFGYCVYVVCLVLFVALLAWEQFQVHPEGQVTF
jgi:hypothetical protein